MLATSFGARRCVLCPPSAENPRITVLGPGGAIRWEICCDYQNPKGAMRCWKHHNECNKGGCFVRFFARVLAACGELARSPVENGIRFREKEDGTEDPTHILVAHASLRLLQDELSLLSTLGQLSQKVPSDSRCEPPSRARAQLPTAGRSLTSHPRAPPHQLNSPSYPHLPAMLLDVMGLGVDIQPTQAAWSSMFEWVGERSATVSDDVTSALLLLASQREANFAAISAKLFQTDAALKDAVVQIAGAQIANVVSSPTRPPSSRTPLL